MPKKVSRRPRPFQISDHCHLQLRLMKVVLDRDMYLLVEEAVQTKWDDLMADPTLGPVLQQAVNMHTAVNGE